MASSYTTRLRLEKQGSGENSDSWGTKLNTVIDLVDEAADGYLAKSVAGSSDVTLSSNNSATDESRQRTLKFTGVLTGNISVIVPAVEKHYAVWNATTGDFTLTFKPSGGTGLEIPQDSVCSTFTDGTTMYKVGPWTPHRRAVSLGSGTTETISRIPATASRITLSLADVSTNGTSNILLQLGDSGGIETSSYAGTNTRFTTAPAVAISSHGSTTGFVIDGGPAAGTSLRGVYLLTLVDASTNTWSVSGQGTRGGSSHNITVGHKALSATITQMRLTMENGSDTFDAGTYHLIVE